MRERGGASVEFIALLAMIAMVFAAITGVTLAGGDGKAERWLGTRIGMKIRCAARYPDPCWRDPLVEAYGRPLAGLVRAWAPQVPRVTATRRPLAYTTVADTRRRDGMVRISYRFRTTAASWTTKVLTGSSADVKRHSRTPLLESADPRLVPVSR